MHQLFVLAFLVTICQSSVIPENVYDFEQIINTVNSNKDATWQAGHNFDPSTRPETIRRLCSAQINENREYHYKDKDDYNDINDIPPTFDARDNWPKCQTLISQIRDQGNCGSCWAVSAAAAFTDRKCIATDGTFKSPLSSEDVLSCCNTCGHGCDGGFPFYAWKHFQTYGIVTGGEYRTNKGCKPYSTEPCDHHINGSLPLCSSIPDLETPKCYFKCTNSRGAGYYWADHHKVTSYYAVDATVESIQKEIMKYGPVQVIFAVYEDFLAYKTGVYQHTTGSKVGNHAVKVIGWGTQNNIPYWTVVNSWNANWGDQGYFKILRGKNECSIETYIYAGLP